MKNVILIAGLVLVVLSAGGASADRQAQTARPSFATPAEKPASTVVSDDQQNKLRPISVEPQHRKPVSAVDLPVYKPPLRGAPGGRVAGGTRGTEESLFRLAVLAPDHTGLTVHAQPTLYWYVSKLLPYPIELTIIAEQAIYPMVESRLRAPVQPGVQRARLAQYDVRLAPGVPYQWFVALVRDPDSRSKDTIASGTIERIELSETLRMKLERAGKAKAPHVYAAAGLWYDTVMAISELIEASPLDIGLRKQRAALLEQVGLADIAAYDMQHQVLHSP
jgi:hypothetical protein